MTAPRLPDPVFVDGAYIRASFTAASLCSGPSEFPGAMLGPQLVSAPADASALPWGDPSLELGGSASAGRPFRDGQSRACALFAGSASRHRFFFDSVGSRARTLAGSRVTDRTPKAV